MSQPGLDNASINMRFILALAISKRKTAFIKKPRFPKSHVTQANKMYDDTFNDWELYWDSEDSAVKIEDENGHVIYDGKFLYTFEDSNVKPESLELFECPKSRWVFLECNEDIQHVQCGYEDLKKCVYKSRVGETITISMQYSKKVIESARKSMNYLGLNDKR